MSPRVYVELCKADLEAEQVCKEGMDVYTTLVAAAGYAVPRSNGTAIPLPWTPELQLHLAARHPTFLAWLLAKHWVPCWDMTGVEMVGWDMRGAYLRRLNLQQADLTSACLHKADLQEACLMGAVLARTDLSEARLLGANLAGVFFYNTDLEGANLEGAFYPAGDVPAGWVRSNGHLKRPVGGIKNRRF